MGVYCGVCANRIYDASDNFGPFSVDASFDNGWEYSSSDYNPKRYPRISHTCDSCYSVLAKAVANAAKEIAAKNTAGIESLKAEIAQWEENSRRYKQERKEFEAAWKARKS